jgi:hypothetical protein
VRLTKLSFCELSPEVGKLPQKHSKIYLRALFVTVEIGGIDLIIPNRILKLLRNRRFLLFCVRHARYREKS